MEIYNEQNQLFNVTRAKLSCLTENGEKLRQEKVSTLQELINALHEAFKTDRVNIDHVQDLMINYKSNPQDWKKFAKFDRHRYTRNLVDEGNGRFNLMVLCWGEGHGSAIHDHADAHCVMKVLQGKLCEDYAVSLAEQLGLRGPHTGRPLGKYLKEEHLEKLRDEQVCQLYELMLAATGKNTENNAKEKT